MTSSSRSKLQVKLKACAAALSELKARVRVQVVVPQVYLGQRARGGKRRSEGASSLGADAVLEEIDAG